MMDYLKKYGLSDKQINNIEKVFIDSDLNMDIFEFEPEEFIETLDMFVDYGIKDIYELIISTPGIFADSFESIKKRLDAYGSKEEVANYINEDINNLVHLGLM